MFRIPDTDTLSETIYENILLKIMYSLINDKHIYTSLLDWVQVEKKSRKKRHMRCQTTWSGVSRTMLVEIEQLGFHMFFSI